MNHNRKWSLKKDTILEMNPDGVTGILIDTNYANYCSCNRNATLLINELSKKKQTVSELTKILVKKNKVALSTARKDVTDFLTKLNNLRMLND